MDALRTAVSILAHFDPDAADNSRAANLRKAERLLGADSGRRRRRSTASAKGQPPVPPRPTWPTPPTSCTCCAARKPKPADVKALDVSLILYAEHEFNASTFTARVVVSTESDLHSAIVAAIGALKGRLHGGANEKVMDLLRAGRRPGRRPRSGCATPWPQEDEDHGLRPSRLQGRRRAGRHPEGVTPSRRPQATGQTQWEETAEIIEQVMAQEKNLFPNLDWPAGRLYHALGLEVPLYTPIFVMSRITGWAAHVIEQNSHNRLIRPRGRYTGPAKRAVKPLAER